MSNSGWFTMKDVLGDLEEVSGRRIQHFDNRFAVAQERPPPVKSDEEDDFLLMYKDCISKDPIRAEPDLAGIKHMLRMVNDYFDDSTCDDNENMKELKKNVNTILTISKLNPNVPEFVPRGKPSTSNVTQGTQAQIEESRSSAISTAEEQKTKLIHNLNQGTKARNGESMYATNSDVKCFDLEYSFKCESLVCKDNIQMNKTDVSHKTKASHETNNNDIDINKKIDISSLDSEEIKFMREKLKLKIMNTSKTDCLRKKQEKNLAIASLLKLYAEIPANSTDSKSVELMTPDYFKTVPQDNLRAHSDCSGKFEAQHNGHGNSENNKIMLNYESVNIKMKKSLNNEDKVPYLSQEPQKSRLIPTRPTTQSQDEKSDSPNPVTCKRKGTKYVPQNVHISETPASALTSDSFMISSHNDKMIISNTEQCKAKEISLLSNLTNIKKTVHEVDDVQCLLQDTSNQSQESNSKPTSHLQDDKTDFNNDISSDGFLKQENIDQPLTKEVKESIKKVKNWLKVKPEKHKSPWLGPVTYKRKENKSVPQSVDISESPLSGSVPESLDISDKSSSALTGNSFVPTSYADELARTYMERSKLKEARSEDIWTKLERKLKEKDKVLKEKMNEEVQRCA